MATYWIDPVSGVNTNDGLTPATARLTLIGFDTAVAINLVNDDIINLLPGTHQWALNASEYTVDANITIRGRTAADAPATATIAATSAGARRHILATAGSVITFENITFDVTAQTADGGVYDLIRYNASTGLMSFRGCSFLASSLGGTAPAAARRLINTVTNPGTGVAIASFHRCYFQNWAGYGLWNTANSESHTECVFIGDLTALTWFSKNLTGGTVTATNCTWYLVMAGATAVGAPLSMSSTSGTGVTNVHSNIVYANTTLAASLIGFMRDSAGLGAPTGTIGFNVLLGGSDVTSGEIYSNGWYERNHDPDNNDGTGSDTYPTDQVSYGVAPATMFNNPSGTFAWSTVNGLTLLLPKDLRPRLFLTASQSGGVPGALPPAETDLSVTVAADNTAPDVDETVVLTVTAANDGTAATSVVYSAPIPAGLTFVSAVPSAGSYAAGVWTIGALADSDSETLVLTVTVDSDQVGNNIVFTASVTSADPANDPDASNNTASRTLNVQQPDPEEDPEQTPYLDVAPIFAPVLLAEINAIIRTKRNKITQHELRRDFEDRTWREFTSRRLTIAPSTTLPVISSIERVDFIIMESTGNVEVSASSGDTDQYFPAATRLSVLDGDFTTLKLRNPSATDSVDVLLVVID